MPTRAYSTTIDDKRPKQYIGEMETRFIKETEMFFGNFEGKDVRSGSFTAEHF